MPGARACRVALAWSRIQPEQQEVALRLAVALVWPWRLSGHAGEAFDWLATLLIGAPPNATRAKALRAAGSLAQRRAGPDAKPLLDEALSLARSLEERRIIVATLFDLAFLWLELGDPPAAEAALDEALDLAQMPDVIAARPELLRLLGRALAAMGRPEEAVAHLREAVRLAREQQDLYTTRMTLRELGSVLLDLGEIAAARAYLEDSLARETRPPDATLALEQFVGLAVAEGDMVGAVRLAGAAGGLREAWHDRFPRALPPRLEQQLKTASEALAPAVRQAAWAEGAAMSLDEAIDCAFRRGPRGGNAPERTRTLLHQLLATDELGMEHWAAGVQALLAHPSLVAARAAPAYPDGLTAREVEIIRLIAAGLSNSQIAGDLVVSARTVERHIENIYGKLGVHGRSARAAVATYAAHHELLPAP